MGPSNDAESCRIGWMPREIREKQAPKKPERHAHMPQSQRRSTMRALVTALALRLSTVAAFSPTRPAKCSVLHLSRCHERTSLARAATPASKSDVHIHAKNDAVPVTRVSVCADDLCQCQGAGGASSHAIEELEGLGLPFPVYEVGCLGACGMGTVIAIDYENGDTSLMDGLESTLVELGIPPRRDQETTKDHVKSFEKEAVADAAGRANEGTSPSSAISVKDDVAPEKSHVMVDERDRMRQDATDDAGKAFDKAAKAFDKAAKSFDKATKSLDKAAKSLDKAAGRAKEGTSPSGAIGVKDDVAPEKPHGMVVRDRMRQEAAENVENPWLNMVSYLGKNATDTILGGFEH